MKRLRAAVFLLASGLLAILAFQNLEAVDVHVFFQKWKLSPSLLIVLSWLLGALTGRPLWRLLVRAAKGERPPHAPSSGPSAGGSARPPS